MTRTAALVASTLVAASAVAIVRSRDTFREVRFVMGTTAEVRLLGAQDEPAAVDAAFAALQRVDDSMSLWKETELTRLNDDGSGVVSSELWTVLVHALEVAGSSGGAFDPTVEPLVRAAGRLGDPPRRLRGGERRRLLSSVGYQRVHLDASSRSLRLEPGTRLDLGGIAKGYAVDLALEALRSAGATIGLVDLGGSSVAAFGEEIEFAVRDPVHPEKTPWTTFRLRDGAFSTSAGDQRPDHILDPRTGMPARGVSSATVIAATAMEADALSTAVYVLGARQGLALVWKRGAHGLVLQRTRGVCQVVTTPGFARRFGLRTAPGVNVSEVAPVE